jgi:hypothetical protein
MRYDWPKENNEFKNQYTPTPTAEKATIKPITPENIVWNKRIRFCCLLPLSLVAIALRLRCFAQRCGSFIDKNCAGITSNKKKIKVQPI